ncbi:MAG TPA: cytochrome c biogenesis protein CcsA [Candidatus Polarisedimenticolaceae bacterium]|nr:cytochrome c biogenesis protein CcsA [Candidatus Polarisedimenticolaceae bacterium]
MNLGDLAVHAAAAFAAAAFVAALAWVRGSASAERLFRWTYLGLTASLAAASALLLVAIFTHDFRFSYVYGYSSRDLPFLYLLSAFWAGQQGSFLLWALIGALLGLPLYRKGAFEPAKVMACYVPTVGALTFLMLDPAANPFTLAPEVAPDGRGLNPLLQDPWMASHPPMVFFGYAAAAIPFAFALVAALGKQDKKDDARWLAPALRWALVSFVLLGVGIVLGGFWAYKVLGWGGYWGWDPVENASLVPWLVTTALLHGLVIQRRTGALRLTNLVLALGGYVLVLYSTFLTRSGVLADFSVHSFPAGTLYRKLLIVQLAALAVAAFGLWRARGRTAKTLTASLSWPALIAAAVLLFAVSAVFVGVGTSWPLISSLAGKPSVPQAPFYNFVNLPVVVLLLALLGLVPALGWQVMPATLWRKRVITAYGLAAGGTLVAWFLGGRGAAALTLFFVGLAALAANLLKLVRTARNMPWAAGAPLAHVGFACMFLGIVGSSAWGTGREVRLPLGQSVEAFGATYAFRGHVDGTEPKDAWRVDVNGKPRTFLMYPQKDGDGHDSLFRRTVIERQWRGDLYLVPHGIDTPAGDGVLELEKQRTGTLGDTALTFLGFETGNGAHGMMVRAKVALKRGEAEETLALPMEVTESGLQAAAVPSSVLPGAKLTLQRMSVEQGTVYVAVSGVGGSAAPVLVTEISTKPLIGVLWFGTLLLTLGCAVAAARAFREAAHGRVRSAEIAGPARPGGIEALSLSPSSLHGSSGT